MTPGPIPPDDRQRLSALHGYEILDTNEDENFDRLTRLAAAAVTGCPKAAISLIDRDWQWLKSNLAMPFRQASREFAFCSYTILANQPMMVPDARADARFADNPFVTGEPGLRFYAGAPLTTPAGFNIGAICVLDTVPRELPPEQLRMLSDLAATAMMTLELYRTLREMKRLATVDLLTELPNRAQFFLALNAEMAACQQKATPFSLLYIDFDDFKQVNDALSLEAADALLQQLAFQLRAGSRAGDTPGRIGGDEFALLLPGTGAVAARAIADRLLLACLEKMVRPEVKVSISIGIATFLICPPTATQALYAADAAMFASKRHGKGQVRSVTIGHRGPTPPGPKTVPLVSMWR